MTVECKNILEINLNSSDLLLLAKRIIELPVFNKIIERKDRLERVTLKNNLDVFKNNNTAALRETFIKFKLNFYNVFQTGFSTRELKNLSFALNYEIDEHTSIFDNPTELRLLLEYLNSNWRDIYLLGLFDCLLKRWGDTESFAILNSFFVEKIINYTGNRKLLSEIKNNIKYFRASNGNVLLGADLAHLDLGPVEATSYLKLPDTWITYNYFSLVIDTFFEKKKSTLFSIMKDLDIAFDKHSNSITNKRTVSKIIIYSHYRRDEELKQKAKSMAFKHIGDPENNQKWNFVEGTEEERGMLLEAQRILNAWIIEQFISVFFEKCINDSRRKQFWLEYTKHISEFRVVGSRHIKRILKEDQRIKDLVDARFIYTLNQNIQNSAIVLKIRDHILVEFSDSGSFYAYRSANPRAPNFASRNIRSINSLKDTSMPTLFYRQGNYIHSLKVEGKKPHTDGYLDWETALTYWIENVVMD